MNCSCHANEKLQKFESDMSELAENAKRLIRSASDPFSGVIKFLQERPDNMSLPGISMKQVLLDAFGSREQIPGLVRVLSSHVREVVRHSNIIDVRNEHLSQEQWSGYLIKLKEQIKFEIAKDKDKLVLKNIAGLVCVEHGVEVPLERILVNPPKLEITVRLGILRPVRTVDIMA